MALEHTRGREATDRSWFARLWFACGALMGLLAVAAAALTAHLPDRMLAMGGREALRAAVQLIGWHAAALLAASLRLGQMELGQMGPGLGGRPRLIHLAAICFLIGTACFCAGVAVPAFGGPHLGPVAPTGGSLLMIGWALLAASALPGRFRR